NLFAQDKYKNLLQEAENLKTTGAISVSVGGDFFINGTFSAFVTERLDHFLTRILYASIGGSTEENEGPKSTTEELNTLLDQTIKRNIKIIHADGSDQLVDLDKYYLTGDISQNPYLKMDDLIIFNKINLETNYVIVDGAVKKKLKFPFVQGDKLSDALLFAHGIDNAYRNVEFAEIVRLSYDGNSINVDSVNLKNADSFLLQPGDVIRVIGEDNYKKDYKVLVVGAVNKPGYVYITKDKTTLREVLERAKGFKDNAWLEYGELVRPTTPDKESNSRPVCQFL
ncbi:SLBB domain-containing protein, partial [Bacteroidota bacterium]